MTEGTMANGKEIILITELVLGISEKKYQHVTDSYRGITKIKSQVTRANGGG